MSLSIGVLEFVCAEDDFIAVFNDSFAGNEYVEPALVCIMDSQLMAVQLEPTVVTVVHKYCGFSDACLDDTILKILQE